MRSSWRLAWEACRLLALAAAIVWARPAAAAKIACVGDSITYGYDLSNPSQQSWPAVLQGLVGSKHTVGNFGTSGCTLLKKGDKPYWNDANFSASDAFQPDVVIVMLGTNDAKPQNWTYQADFTGDYNSMIDHYRALGALVYVAAPPPVFPPGAYSINPDVLNSQIVPLIRQIAAAANAPLIDVYQALSGKSADFPDTVHPNADGAQLIAQTVAAALQQSGFGGAGGSTGTGGSTTGAGGTTMGSGGATGAGGAPPGTGGTTTSSGGVSGTGGSSRGTGGASMSSGGITGTGGSSRGTGGTATGSGGAAGGAPSGTGGSATSSGGISGSGGSPAGNGGSPLATGGFAKGAGGVLAAGGSTTVNGGIAGGAGVSGSGGLPGAGGTTPDTGGVTGTAGGAGTAGSALGGTSGTTGKQTAGASGCGCYTVGGGSMPGWTYGVAFLLLMARRRRGSLAARGGPATGSLLRR